MNGESALGEDLEAQTEEFDLADEFDYDDDESADYDYDDDDSADYDYDDDDSADYDYDDDESSEYDYDDDDAAEFLPGLGIPLIAKGIGGAIKGVGRMLSGGRRRTRRLKPYVPRVRRPSTAISGISNLVGRLRTRSGRSIPFRLPKNIATKRDIAVLRKAVKTNTGNALKNSRGIKKNIQAIAQNSRRIRSVDKKHTSASKTQNRVLNSLNKRVGVMKKDLDETKRQAQMQMMFSLLLKPELSSIRVEPGPDFDEPTTTGTLRVTDSDTGDDNLGLLLAMSGGFGSGKDGMNPLMLLLLTDAL